MSITIALLGAGCAGGGDDDHAGAGRCVPAEEVTADIGASTGAQALAIVAEDDRFDPPCVEIAASGRATLVVRNDGRHPHDLTVDDERHVAVDAGQVAILELDVPEGGVHYVCTIHPGMEGELRLRQ